MPKKKEAFEAMRDITRKKIDSAALSLFAHKGLSVTMDEIARTAGISKGLLYNHYASKDILIANFANRATETSALLIKSIEKSNTSAVAKIKQITSMMCQMLFEQPEGIEYFMFMMQVELNGFRSQEYTGYTVDRQDPIESLASIIAQGQRENSVVSGNVKQLSITYWAMIQGLCCYVITGKCIPIEPKILLRTLLKEDFI